MWAILVFLILANNWPTNVARLLAVARTRSSTDFVFKTFVGDLSGLSNSGVVFSVGLLTKTFAIAGFDGALHLSEEVTTPRVTVPHTMFWGVVLNALLAFGFLIVTLYTMGDFTSALETPTGWPLVEIYYQATNSHAGTCVLMTVGLIAGFVALFGALASVSRLIWAFARDDGLPFSAFFSHVSPCIHAFKVLVFQSETEMLTFKT